MAKDGDPEVGKRVTAVMDEFHIEGNKAMGDICGTTHGAVNNWRNGYNLPRVPEMSRLCEQTGITLDWLYRGLRRLDGPEAGVTSEPTHTERVKVAMINA
jgi:hypothetical protein